MPVAIDLALEVGHQFGEATTAVALTLLGGLPGAGANFPNREDVLVVLAAGFASREHDMQGQHAVRTRVADRGIAVEGSRAGIEQYWATPCAVDLGDIGHIIGRARFI